jgi:hypothetical protein
MAGRVGFAKKEDFPVNLLTKRAIYRAALLFALAMFISFGAGCASDEGHMQMVSLDQKHDLAQNFTQAFIGHSPSGDTDIVLVSEGGPVKSDIDPRQPLQPEASVMPRQIVHIRVFWKAISYKADHPAATNASIHWYVLGDSADQGGMLEYTGSGLVLTDDASDGATVKVVKAWMKNATQTGGMTDPLGPSMMTGKIRATTDQQHLTAVLAQIQQIAANGYQASASAGQPQRMMVGP